MTSRHLGYMHGNLMGMNIIYITYQVYFNYSYSIAYHHNTARQLLLAADIMPSDMSPL